MDITNKDLKDLKSSSKQVMERAFNDIYQEYKLLVFFVSFDILKNQEDAKDITNETFMQFFINKNKNIGIIGIACIPNLISGGFKALRLGFIPQCVVLDYCGCSNHWLYKKHMTKINENRLLYIILNN